MVDDMEACPRHGTSDPQRLKPWPSAAGSGPFGRDADDVILSRRLSRSASRQADMETLERAITSNIDKDQKWTGGLAITA